MAGGRYYAVLGFLERRPNACVLLARSGQPVAIQNEQFRTIATFPTNAFPCSTGIPARPLDRQIAKDDGNTQPTLSPCSHHFTPRIAGVAGSGIYLTFRNTKVVDTLRMARSDRRTFIPSTGTFVVFSDMPTW